MIYTLTPSALIDVDLGSMLDQFRATGHEVTVASARKRGRFAFGNHLRLLDFRCWLEAWLRHAWKVRLWHAVGRREGAVTCLERRLNRREEARFDAAESRSIGGPIVNVSLHGGMRRSAIRDEVAGVKVVGEVDDSVLDTPNMAAAKKRPGVESTGAEEEEIKPIPGTLDDHHPGIEVCWSDPHWGVCECFGQGSLCPLHHEDAGVVEDVLVVLSHQPLCSEVFVSAPCQRFLRYLQGRVHR